MLSYYLLIKYLKTATYYACSQPDGDCEWYKNQTFISFFFFLKTEIVIFFTFITSLLTWKCNIIICRKKKKKDFVLCDWTYRWPTLYTSFVADVVKYRFTFYLRWRYNCAMNSKFALNLFFFYRSRWGCWLTPNISEDIEKIPGNYLS